MNNINVMTKGELIDLVLTDDEKRNIDIALPLQFIVDTEKLGYTNNAKYFVWMYGNGSVTGHPVNLAELYVERFLCKDATNNIIDTNEAAAQFDPLLKHIHGVH